MHSSASGEPSKAACIADTVFPAACVDKRKELADALHDLDADPRTKWTVLMDLKTRFTLSTRIIGIPIQEAFNNVRKELVTLQQMHNSVSGEPSKAACVTVTVFPADAAFTSQVPSAGEPSATGDPPVDECVPLQTCPASRNDGTNLDHSENRSVANVPAPGSVENVQASGTTNNAARITATGVCADAAFTSQDPSAGESLSDRSSARQRESAATDVSRGTARRNTCASLGEPLGGEMDRAGMRRSWVSLVGHARQGRVDISSRLCQFAW